MVNKIYGCDQSISIVTRSRKPATISKSPPTPEVAITTTRVAAGPGFHSINLSLSVIIVANISIDNATIIAIQISQVTFDIVRNRK